MPYSEEDVRLEIEAALATYYPGEDWIRNVAAKYVWGSRANKDLVGLVDECERVVTLWYHKRTLVVARIDPDALSGKHGRDAEQHHPVTREGVPAFVRDHRDRFDWIHPDWRRPPHPTVDGFLTPAARRRLGD